MKNVSYSREIPLKYEVDVFVAGAGPAGMAASCSAAKHGAKVLLVDMNSCLGGTGTCSGLAAFGHFSDGVRFLSGGFGREVYERMFDEGGEGPDSVKSETPEMFFRYNPEVLKRLYDKMAEEAGVDFLFHVKLIDVIMDGRKVAKAVCAGKSGVFAVSAKLFVDATGDADLCALAGARYEKGDAEGALQPGTLCNLWADIDWERTGDVCPERELQRGFDKGVFSVEDRHLPGFMRVGGSAGWGNIGHAFGVDGTDERSLTRALVAGRRLVLEYERFYKECLAGYERMRLLATGAVLGVRETRRVVGDYSLKLDDFKRRAVFEDEIGRFAYPVDLHATSPDAKKFEQFEKEYNTLRYAPGESYGIPFRCLLPADLENALVAGRSLSCDRYIQGSIRTQPGCFITGQAAGIAAALAASSGRALRELDVRELQRSLKDFGAYLPNFKG